MGVIKTALELALERTENVKSDKSVIGQFEMKQKGKKIANSFLDENIDILAEIKKSASEQEQKDSLKQGIFDILITQIALPSGEDEKKRIEKVGQGLSAILENSKEKNEFAAMYKQLLQIISQYLQEAAHYEKAIRQQYAPKLRQKEEEISRRMGREVRIDPMQDPEFVAFYNQAFASLKSKYEPVVEQAKEEARRMFEGLNSSGSAGN
ncbi:MAG: hypothetical protein FWB86_05360 [Treponema sp.]|nr:hypothetical protein [Treponema sp.]